LATEAPQEFINVIYNNNTVCRLKLSMHYSNGQFTREENNSIRFNSVSHLIQFFVLLPIVDRNGNDSSAMAQNENEYESMKPKQ